MLYLTVLPKHQEANAKLMPCVLNDAQQWAKNKEIINADDFNGHMSELGGSMHANDRLLLQLAEDLRLEMANLGQRCERKLTWCMWGTATTVDYALVSPHLSALLQTLCTDELGVHSLGSEHNRMLLDFAHGGQKKHGSLRL